MRKTMADVSRRDVGRLFFGKPTLMFSEERRTLMRQSKVTTYAMMCRCDIGDAMKVYALAEKRGVTMSALVAGLIRRAVANVAVTPEAEKWAKGVLAKNADRRRKADERVRSGADRKEGWRDTPKWRKILGNEKKGE